MAAFVQTYGLWIALALVFIAMHWFGRGCCGGGHHGSEDEPSRDDPGERAGVGNATGVPPRSGGGSR